jgi:tetratricopeptide (TPR) repeat protein
MATIALVVLLALTGCSTKNNTAKTRWWHAFNARYNTYFNGSQAFIEGSLEKEQGNKDNYTELIPLYTVGNKQSRDLGKGNFDRAIEKSEKAIKQHSIKTRPQWNKNRRKTQKDIEWLNRREYNPFIWKAWLLLGKSQFQKGEFEEAAATFSYMSRLYHTQPAINGLARAWLAKSYTELDWLYDAEDVINKQRRDTMHFRAVKDWDYTYADYYIHCQRYEEALPYLRKVIRHEKRRKQKAREWFLYGQLQALLGRKTEAYDAFKHTVRLNPPYELEFNARIAQTEVMARGSKNARQMVKRLKRMAASDNNKDYQDQVYYAIGNIWLAEHDTTQAIEAYEEGNKKATRSGIEKGVLLLTLGNLYWEREKFADAQRCYGEAIGLLDKDRKDYLQLSERSKILDELVPHTSSVELQDSL